MICGVSGGASLSVLAEVGEAAGGLSRFRPRDAGFDKGGLIIRSGGEDSVVRGVKACAPDKVPGLEPVGGLLAPLKIEETVLVCELAEPTPFNKSPTADSTSSCAVPLATTPPFTRPCP